MVFWQASKPSLTVTVQRDLQRHRGRAVIWSIWGETSCPSFWFVFYFSIVILWLCVFGSLCVCLRACVCFDGGGGVPASVCFLEYTLYLWPDWTPGYKHKKRKRNHCSTASGEINLEATKEGSIFTLFHSFSQHTQQADKIQIIYIIAGLDIFIYFLF